MTMKNMTTTVAGDRAYMLVARLPDKSKTVLAGNAVALSERFVKNGRLQWPKLLLLHCDYGKEDGMMGNEVLTKQYGLDALGILIPGIEIEHRDVVAWRTKKGRAAPFRWPHRESGTLIQRSWEARRKGNCIDCGPSPLHADDRCLRCGKSVHDMLEPDRLPKSVLRRITLKVLIESPVWMGHVLEFPCGARCTVVRIHKMPYYVSGERVDVLLGPDTTVKLPHTRVLQRRRKDGAVKRAFCKVGMIEGVLVAQDEDAKLRDVAILAPQTEGLLRSGMPMIAKDLLTDPDAPGRLRWILAAMGFDARIDDGSMRIGLQTDEGCKALSAGEVDLTDETYYKERNTPPQELDERCGHMELSMPIVHPLFIGRIARRLGCRAELVADIIAKRTALVTRIDGAFDAERWTTFAAFIALSETLREKWSEERARNAMDRIKAGMIVDTEDKDAISFFDLLRAMDVSWIGLRTGEELIRDALAALGLPADGVLRRVICVLPPALRPRGSDVEQLYRRLANRTKRHRNLISLNAPAQIQWNEGRMCQEAFGCVLDNERQNKPCIDNDKPLASLATMLHTGIDGLRTGQSDDCVRARAVPAGFTRPGTLGVPDAMMLRLYGKLLERAFKEYGEAAASMARTDDALGAMKQAVEQVMTLHPLVVFTDDGKVGTFKAEQCGDVRFILIHPDDARTLGLRFEGDLLTLHLPKKAEAQREMTQPTPMNPMSALLALNENLPERLVEAALSGKPIPLSAADRIMLGVE
jgi:hypothetical protein